jgi:hypothetical protein
LQRRMQFAGLNAMVLPVRVREDLPSRPADPDPPRAAPELTGVGAGRRNRLSLLMLAGLSLAISACADGPSRSEGAHDDIEGLWTVTVRLTSPSRLTISVDEAQPISGELALIRAEHASSTTSGFSGPPTHFGAYRIDFGAFGVDPPLEQEVPSAVFRIFGDSVEATLGSGERPIHMAGRLAGDSVGGAWWQPGGHAVGAATGTFVLLRRQVTSTLPPDRGAGR